MRQGFAILLEIKIVKEKNIFQYQPYTTSFHIVLSS